MKRRIALTVSVLSLGSFAGPAWLTPSPAQAAGPMSTPAATSAANSAKPWLCVAVTEVNLGVCES